jgi:peptidoglycan/xylan/chitin deacetylase (PgdA/CDA1 family)
MAAKDLKSHEVEWEGAVTLSFDDGWKSVYDNAFPLLEKAGIKATYYIVSGYLDDAQFPLYMNAADIFDLARASHEIGCHTVSHKHLPQESDKIIDNEIILSLAFLRGLGITIETFAYPFGEFDTRVLSAVNTTGFSGARSVIRGFNDESTDRFLLRTQVVKVTTPVSDVIAWIEYARTHRKWLILTFHQIDWEGREWSTRPETLAQILNYLRNHDVGTITVTQGLAAMRTHHPAP